MVSITIEKKQRVDAYFQGVGQFFWSTIQPYDFLLDDSIPLSAAKSVSHWSVREAYELLNDDPEEWDAFDERFLVLMMTHKSAGDFYDYDLVKRWLMPKLGYTTSTRFLDSVGAALKRIVGVSTTEWLAGLLCYSGKWYYQEPEEAYKTGEKRLIDYVFNRDDSAIAEIAHDLGYKSHLLVQMLLIKNKIGLVDQLSPIFLRHLPAADTRLSINLCCADVLLSLNALRYEPLIEAQMADISESSALLSLQDKLRIHLPQKYEALTLQMAYDYMGCVRREMILRKGELFFSGSYSIERRTVYDLEKPVATVLDEGGTEGIAYVGSWLKQMSRIPEGLLHVFAERASQIGPDFFMESFRMYKNWEFESGRQFFRDFFKLLPAFDYSAYYPEIWALTRHKSKKMRELAAVTLAKLGETAIPEAQKLLNDKKADVRQTGSLILSLIRTDRAQQLLLNALEAERNDDARDLMLDSLTGMLPTPTTEAGVLEMVEKARQRGKLDLPALPFVAETALPALYWRESGNPLDVDTVRFLLYRQGRSKDIRPDAEAWPLYALIDRNRSQPFANAILKAYFESGADAKYKGCLTVGALLGGPDATDLLKAKVNAWTEASRGKMAEYAVQALALVGDNKALRAVEFFARKYKSKNKNVGSAAQEAFGIAAQTLGISPYDLADSIIPDFGFEGLFRSFEVDGETYRAFVGTDFKLAFLDEDNRLMKSLPKATSTTLKDEFKEVGKEIRDIVKAQSGRLEQYLVTQRKWPADRWQALFMGNPVMFTYAIRLIWGVFNADQTLVYSFQCLEDQTLVNEEGDEVEWPQDAQLGMVHPLSLTPEQIAHWTEQLADADLIPILPQLTRRVVTLPETARTLTKDRQFEGVEHGGFGFVSKMEKLGWYRGSVQDGGWIANYYKDFSDLGITALLSQQGNISVGYYDENAALGPVMFVRSGSVRFGNYVYDEPEKDTDERLILFGQVPPIVYSEVMADLSFFKENDQRKTTVNP